MGLSPSLMTGCGLGNCTLRKGSAIVSVCWLVITTGGVYQWLKGLAATLDMLEGWTLVRKLGDLVAILRTSVVLANTCTMA